MGVKLLTGNAALACVNSAAFQSSWRSLCAACPWVTACQHPDFVVTWYHHYQSRLLPVVVVEQTGDGALVGLLTLALNRGTMKLSGAGDCQAEYQGWISMPAAGEHFILAALAAVRACFPHADLCLKYLPPGITPPDLGAIEQYRKLVSLHRHRRPLMRIDAAAMAHQRSKKNHRQNFNRLARLGKVHFEKLVEHRHFTEALDDMSMQYDFRQAALYRCMPFSEDPFKKPFYRALHEKGLLHATILTVGEAIAASHLGLSSGGQVVHLGMNTHHPAFAAHSPGNLLLAMLGVDLAADNIAWLDLTPGGDGYKEHFATEHDDVVELTVYGNRWRRWKQESLVAAKQLVKTRLQSSGYRPAEVRALVQKLKSPDMYPLRRLVSTLRSRLSDRAQQFRHCGALPVIPHTKLLISKNCVPDLIGFDASGCAVRYQDFMSAAMRRMERSHDAYSLVRDETLWICCWARTVPVDAGQSAKTARPGAGIILLDLYVHRDAHQCGLLSDFFAQLLCDLKGRAPDVSVCYQGVLDSASQAAIARCGFVEERAHRPGKGNDEGSRGERHLKTG